MTSPIIQKDIVIACKIETVKAFLEELNGDYFALLVDESFTISRKEQMAIVLRYVDRMGFVMVRLIDIIHIQDTSALSLKETIINLLAQHSLSPSRVRGQCYDGASNMQVLESLALDARSMDERAKAMGHLESCQTFEVAFMLHLMRDVLAITNELNKCLQRKEQDVANAMLLVEVAKKRLQVLRDDEWNSLIAKLFKITAKTCSLYTLQELNDRFNEVATDLLYGIACLNPINSFSSFDSKKIMRMAELYPDDFDEYNMDTLENQLASYIVDVRDVDERFSDLNGLCDLSKRLVQTKKHSNYPLVFRLVKLALLLPVAIASVERAFSAMKFIKNDLRSQMGDDFFSGCLVPFVEKDVFDSIPNDAIIKTFQDMKPRREQL
ncbi:uncharacterized protein [Solanum tuberosum]|uniref:uncharacterized protein n=1 Tax=Solanum tuberosum TaxID=4113 RepID=UPI00073A140E|nr:PREDICTED: uncharacterized protein LOC107063322 [Solanum tuberosum]